MVSTPGVGGFQVAVAGQDAAHPVEGLGDGVGAALDLADQPVRFLAELPPALRPARVVLTFAAAVAGVGAELPAQFRDLLFLVRQGRGAAEVVVPARRGRRPVLPQGVADRGRQVPPRLGHLGVEGLRDPDPGDRGQRALRRPAMPIRRSWLSRVMTAGRGSREWWSELRTTASPGARPVGTSTTSPGSSRLRESSVTDFRARELVLEAFFSASESARRIRAVLGEVAQVAASWPC